MAAQYNAHCAASALLGNRMWLCFQVVVEAVFTQKPSKTVKIFIVVVSLVLGLLILASLIWCLWKVKNLLLSH